MKRMMYEKRLRVKARDQRYRQRLADKEHRREIKVAFKLRDKAERAQRNETRRRRRLERSMGVGGGEDGSVVSGLGSGGGSVSGGSVRSGTVGSNSNTQQQQQYTSSSESENTLVSHSPSSSEPERSDDTINELSGIRGRVAEFTR